MVRNLQTQEQTVDEKLDDSKISLFSHSAPISSRQRRPMNFSEEIDTGDQEDDSDSESDLEMDNGNEFKRSAPRDLFRVDDSDSNEESDDEDVKDTEDRSWFDNVAALYKGKGKNLMEIVYGERAVDSRDANSDDDGELLRLVNDKQNEHSVFVDTIDSSLYCPTSEEWTNWEESEMMEKLKDRFSGAAWFEDVDESLINDSDEEVYGDFEDLEAAEGDEQMKDENDDEESDEEDDSEGDEESAQMKRLKAKEALKAKFNAEYDDENDSNYLEDLQAQTEKQIRLNEEEFAQDDPVLRAQLLGYECGTYIRIQLSGIPCEFVENFDPKLPLVVGGLLPNEHNLGFVQTRVKRHRWHRKILKNNDPIIISMGWRRFQTLPLYSLADDSMRHRMLKYTPEHMHCYATFYGPVTPPNTGFIGFQHLRNNVSTFRVAITGVVLEVDQSFQIVKKLKLTGNPFKTYKNTAFIRGMFNSELEVAKFQGAAVRTVSGIRGQIKKPLKVPGTFRATFEDKVQFLRTWYPVHAQKFYNPVTSLLDSEWTGMRTVFQLRKDKQLRVPVNQDSLYKPVEREARKFNPLRIPKALEKELPFAAKPKRLQKKEKLERPVLIGYGNKEERQVNHLLQQLGTVKNEKIRKQKEKREKDYAKRQKVVQAEKEKREERTKASRKRVFRLQGIEKERAAKKRKY
eukprot:CAMPEP_0206198130 /NCGR_PEP_ID=MMETSP0166-20121206/9450_1 /ASSEMBLY_ACC=CAM_ASM_000260 /TAXON_ID=95228 /ORGANISM="Vannella robusta, Strain DIVA3 518/3/11/1/6" /LENGTH=685 /DNA_ID=CAMNT_0053615917 /DNA_START=180 /DNA_END=2237 /DNA_ORIENTATION=-